MIAMMVSDKDECLDAATCSQTCTNTKNSYKCECAPGYTLMPNGNTCKASGKCECASGFKHRAPVGITDWFNLM